MSQSKTMAIIVISTVVLRTKLYVVSLTTRTDDKKQLPDFTSNPNLALEFPSMEDAKNTITNMVNHADKVFTAESIRVPDRNIPKKSMTETQYSESFWRSKR